MDEKDFTKLSYYMYGLFMFIIILLFICFFSLMLYIFCSIMSMLVKNNQIIFAAIYAILVICFWIYQLILFANYDKK